MQNQEAAHASNELPGLLSELQSLAAHSSTDQRLAETLWRTGFHEARMLAAQLADPKRCSRYRLDSWIDSAKGTDEVEAVARVAAHTPLAYETALNWIHSTKERTALAGWSLVAELVTMRRIDAERAQALLECVDEELESPETDSTECKAAVLTARGALESTFPEIGGPESDA